MNKILLSCLIWFEYWNKSNLFTTVLDNIFFLMLVSSRKCLFFIVILGFMRFNECLLFNETTGKGFEEINKFFYLRIDKSNNSRRNFNGIDNFFTFLGVGYGWNKFILKNQN